jgi:alpha-1,3-mannosyl-glycoprotein beta-1,2-N-acetylglucosaminyltransferase
VYELDSSIYCISSFNDNGFKGHSADPREIYRTSFFIGLGWMIKKSIYKEEWERYWPSQHWDHWLRDDARRRNRECIYPEVSRNFNIGRYGAHSDDSLYIQYFEQIQVNRQRAVWLGDINRLVSSNYEMMISSQLAIASQVTTLEELDSVRDVLPNNPNRDIVVGFESSHSEDQVWENVVSAYFHLWHSIPFIRGMHNGLIIFRWNFYR